MLTRNENIPDIAISPASARTGLSVEEIKQGFTDNLFCIQARFPAVASKNDNYQALAYTVRDLSLIHI